MPVNFPSISELGAMGGMDFGAYEQAQNQIGLANQFAQQGLQQGVEDLRAKSLANMYNEQVNPLKVESQRLSNEGTGFDNQSKGVKARNDVALEETEREARRAKALAELSEDKLKELFAKGEAASIDPDPVKAAAGNKMREASWKEQQRRAAAKDALEQTNAIIGGRKAVAETNAGAKISAAELALEGNKYKADVQRGLAELKARNGGRPMNLDQTLAEAYKAAATETDPERKAALTAYAQGIQDIIVTQKQAMAGTQPDVNQLGVPTLKLPGVAQPPTISRPATAAPTVQRPTGPTNNAERGMAAAVADSINIPNIDEEIRRQQGLIDSGALNADDKAVAQQYIAQLKQKKGAGGAKPAPVAGVRQGYVPIYKNGKAVGQVPASQAEAAKAQGYSLQ